MLITAYSQQNKRKYQEDHSLMRFLPNNEILLGVFDGHGGNWTSSYIERHLQTTFRAIRKVYPQLSPEETITLLFQRIHSKTRYFFSGSTAALAWIKLDENLVYTAILGDSQVFIKTSGGAIWESPEHNVASNLVEALAGERRGGRISPNGYLCMPCGGPGLQVGRAFGDHGLDRILNREPEISRVEINEQSWILIGSDGLINPTDPTFRLKKAVIEAADVPKASAFALVSMASSIDSSDNSTAVLAQFS